jgi:hypothetical protein
MMLGRMGDQVVMERQAFLVLHVMILHLDGSQMMQGRQLGKNIQIHSASGHVSRQNFWLLFAYLQTLHHLAIIMVCTYISRQMNIKHCLSKPL